MIFTPIDLERQKFKAVDIMEIDHYNRLSWKGKVMDINDAKTFCDGCGEATYNCFFNHAVEAFETTNLILCDDCWDDFCDNNTGESDGAIKQWVAERRENVAI